MSKKLYGDQDINDLVETDLNSQEEFYKGGVGSGIKGHRTIKDMEYHKRMQPGGGGLDKKRGALKHFDQMYRDAKANNDPDGMEHYGKLRAQATQAVIGQMSPSEKETKIQPSSVDTKADSNKLKDLFGKPADVFTGAGGKKTISLAVSARNWSESQVKASIPKEMSESYNVEIKTQVANGAKSIFINLKQK